MREGTFSPKVSAIGHTPHDVGGDPFPPRLAADIGFVSQRRRTIMQMTRRNFVKTATVAGVGVALFGAAGCAPKADGAGVGAGGAGFTAGTYTAEMPGKFAPVKVQATFSNDAIEQVEVISHEESPFVSDRAIAEIPEMIVENQTLDIDTLTGATLTSAAILGAVSDCVKQAGGDPKHLSDYEKPAPSTEVVDLEADIVIAGAGGAGMACAISAAQLGAEKVIVVEKNSNYGGNCLVSGGFVEFIDAPNEMRCPTTPDLENTFAEEMAAIKGKIPEETYNKIMGDFNAWQAEGTGLAFDSVEFQSVEYALMYGEDNIDYPANYDFCYNVQQFANWMADQGFPFAELCSIVGYPWPRWTHPSEGNLGNGYFTFYGDLMDKEQYPIDIHLCTTATDLITEGDKVVGLTAQADDGTTYNIRASKGVVLATGGFAGNPDMLREYNTMWPFEEGAPIPTTNTNGHTGDGIRMALELGASVGMMDYMMPFPMADVKNATDETTVGDDMDCIIVNKNGERFMNEIQDRYTMTASIMEQPDQVMYMITDADTSLTQGEVSRYGRNLQNLINQEQLYVADTLEELAGMIGCDADTFTATVERYNQFAKAGLDEDFERTFFSDHSAVENPPFYASPRTWAMHITEGGLVYDEQFRVLREDGTPIEGLYSAGEINIGCSGIGTQGEGLKISRILFA